MNPNFTEQQHNRSAVEQKKLGPELFIPSDRLLYDSQNSLHSPTYNATNTSLGTSSDLIESRQISGLISPIELWQRLNDPNVRVIDVDAAESFHQLHIQGRYSGQIVNGEKFWDFRLFENNNGTTKMCDEFAAYLGRLGLDGTQTIVFTEKNSHYGLGRSYRAEFLMKALGYDGNKLFVLDGGNENWSCSGLPTKEGHETNEEKPPLANLSLRFSYLATRSEVISVVKYQDSIPTVLFDVRDPEEWTGEFSSPNNRDESIRGGRIPGSINMAWSNFLVSSPNRSSSDAAHVSPLVLIDADAAAKLIEPMRLERDTPIIIYCYKGSRAALVHKVLTDLLGFTNVRVYFASWGDYAREENVPQRIEWFYSITNTYLRPGKFGLCGGNDWPRACCTL